MAIHDDKLPELEAQLQAAQAAGNDFLVSELAARIASENEKRSRWAVSHTFNEYFFNLINFPPNSLKIALGGTITSDLFMHSYLRSPKPVG